MTRDNAVNPAAGAMLGIGNVDADVLPERKSVVAEHLRAQDKAVAMAGATAHPPG